MASQPLLQGSVALTVGSDSQETESSDSSSDDDFNPIFGRPPLIRLETLTPTYVRWMFAMFYLSLGVTMFFRIEERKAFSCYPLCPQEPSYDSCMIDVLRGGDDLVQCLNSTDDRWVVDLHRMDVWNKWLYLYAGLDHVAEGGNTRVTINYTIQFIREDYTSTDDLSVTYECPASSDNNTISCGVELLSRYDGVHNAQYLIVDVASSVSLSGLRFETLIGNKKFAIVELSFRAFGILITFILLVRLVIMLRLSVFSLWLPEHLWLIWVLVSMILSLDPFWYWGLKHDNFSSKFEKFLFFEQRILYEVGVDVVRAFEFLTLSSLRDATKEKYWTLNGRVFKPAVWSSLWLLAILTSRIIYTAYKPMEYGTYRRSTQLLALPSASDGTPDFVFNIVKALLDLMWYAGIVIQAYRTSRTLEKLPYLQTRYRQLTFRFIVFLYICFIVAWIPPYFIRMFLTHQPPRLQYNIGELIGNTAYICILAYVLTPITDYEHKLVYFNEIPDPSDRKWIETKNYNVELLRFMKGDQSLFFFFTEEERDIFYSTTERAYDKTVAAYAAKHYKHEPHSHLEAKRAMARVKEMLHHGMDAAKDKVMKGAQSVHESVVHLPVAMAALPGRTKEAAVKTASSVKQGVMHPVNTAANISNRTFEICEQTLDKIMTKLEPNPKSGLTRSFHGALGLPVVVGLRDDDTSITVSPPSPVGNSADREPCFSEEPVSPLSSEPSFSTSFSSKFRSKGEQYTTVAWFLEWYDKIMQDVFGFSPIPEPLFCLETSRNLFNLSWEAYFQDPSEELTEDFVMEVDKSLAKRAAKREKNRRKRLATSLKAQQDKIKESSLFKKLKKPTFKESHPEDCAQRKAEFKNKLPALYVGRDDEMPPPKTTKSNSNTPYALLKKNTFVSGTHSLKRRARKNQLSEQEHKERVLLEVLEDKVYIDVEQYGYTLESVINKSQNQVIIASKDDHIAIAFRGTCNADNVKTDITLTRQKIAIFNSSNFLARIATKLGLLQPRVHAGFYKVWTILKDDVLADLNRLTSERHVTKIYLTGHSLGGALATIAAWDLTKWVSEEIGIDKYGQPAIKLCMYNYGCPRVGNPIFTKYYNEMVPDSFRVVNDGDVVCSTPPRMYIPLLGAFYRHAGKQVVVDWRGNFVIRPGFVDRALPKWHIRRNDPTKHQMAGIASDVDNGRANSYRSALDAVFDYCRVDMRCFQVIIQRLEEFDEDQLSATVRLTTTNAKLAFRKSLFDVLWGSEANIAVVAALCISAVAKFSPPRAAGCGLLKSASTASHETMLSSTQPLERLESSSCIETPYFPSRTQSVASSNYEGLTQPLLLNNSSVSTGRRCPLACSPINAVNPLVRTSQGLSSANSTPSTYSRMDAHQLPLNSNSLRYLLVRYGAAASPPSAKATTPSSIATSRHKDHYYQL